MNIKFIDGPQNSCVYLDNKKVGKIIKTSKGWVYIPKNNKYFSGESYLTRDLVKKSLIGDTEES